MQQSPRPDYAAGCWWPCPRQYRWHHSPADLDIQPAAPAVQAAFHRSSHRIRQFPCRCRATGFRQRAPIGIRYIASRPADRHQPTRNFPARQPAAVASRNAVPSGPWPHKSSCRHAGDSYPSRHRRYGPIYGAVSTSRNCLPSSHRGCGDAPASARHAHQAAPAKQSRSSRNRDRISAFPRKSRWWGWTVGSRLERCQSRQSLHAVMQLCGQSQGISADHHNIYTTKPVKTPKYCCFVT